MADPTVEPVAHLFWEYPRDRLKELPDGVVYARVMERGTVSDYRWLLAAHPLHRLQAWYERHAGRHLSPRAQALWSCLLQQPRPRPEGLPWHG